MPPIEDDEVQGTIVRALAKLTEPNLKDYFSPAEIELSLRNCFSQDGINPQWLNWLRENVFQVSGGMTRLEDADAAEFEYRSKDWVATYYRIVGLFSERLVIIQPSSPQVLFVRSRQDAPPTPQP